MRPIKPALLEMTYSFLLLLFPLKPFVVFTSWQGCGGVESSKSRAFYCNRARLSLYIIKGRQFTGHIPGAYFVEALVWMETQEQAPQSHVTGGMYSRLWWLK